MHTPVCLHTADRNAHHHCCRCICCSAHRSVPTFRADVLYFACISEQEGPMYSNAGHTGTPQHTQKPSAAHVQIRTSHHTKALTTAAPNSHTNEQQQAGSARPHAYSPNHTRPHKQPLSTGTSRLVLSHILVTSTPQHRACSTGLTQADVQLCRLQAGAAGKARHRSNRASTNSHGHQTPILSLHVLDHSRNILLCYSHTSQFLLLLQFHAHTLFLQPLLLLLRLRKRLQVLLHTG